jgi:hypothetical protein
MTSWDVIKKKENQWKKGMDRDNIDLIASR